MQGGGLAPVRLYSLYDLHHLSPQMPHIFFIQTCVAMANVGLEANELRTGARPQPPNPTQPCPYNTRSRVSTNRPVMRGYGFLFFDGIFFTGQASPLPKPFPSPGPYQIVALLR